MTDLGDKLLDGTFGLIIAGAVVGSALYIFRDPLIDLINDYRKALATPVVDVRQDVTGSEVPERFVVVDGVRYFAEIDGKPVERYLKRDTPDGGSSF